MNYRPKYIAVGAFAPERVARLWRTDVPETQPAAAPASGAPRPRPRPALAAAGKAKKTK